jgi:two-component system, NarL family, sensor kinase
MAMLCLAFGIVAFVVLYERRANDHQMEIDRMNQEKQQELMLASIESEDRERKRIAAELHDDVGTTLSSIRLFLYKASRTFADEDKIIGQSTLLLDETINRIRNIAHQLQPSTLEYLGLQKSLQSFTELLNRTDSVNVLFSKADSWPAINANTELAIYRIIQELMNNIIKHAKAKTVSIKCCALNNRYCVIISHDGNGLTSNDYQQMIFKEGANGLKNIEYRIKSTNLSIEFDQLNVGEYKIIIWLDK